MSAQPEHTTPEDEALDLSAPTPEKGDAAPAAGPFEDLAAVQGLPRLQSLHVGPDGGLVVGIARLNADETAFVTSLWSVDPAGERPARRLTRGTEGESVAAFLRDGSLLFTAKREMPKDGQETTETTKALWCLPAEGGEAFPIARRDGGWSSVTTARSASLAVLGAPTFAGAATEQEDAEKRKARTDKKLGAILHAGYPVRLWDHDIGAEHPRLLVADLPGSGDAREVGREDVRDLSGDVPGLLTGRHSLSDDGRVLVTGWQARHPHGVMVPSVAVWDTATGERRLVAEATPDRAHEYWAPLVSPDGSKVACAHVTQPDHAKHPLTRLHVVDVASGEGRDIATSWDREPFPVAWSPDGGTLYVQADDDGDGPLFRVDLATEEVTRLTDHGYVSEGVLSPDGATLYAIRGAWDVPPEVIAVDTATGDTRVLDCGIEPLELPGTLERVETTLPDGTRVPGYLCLPRGASADSPAPLALWVHGGPMMSWNNWSWRWCPWLLVSQGYAIVMPDPALSTGYGWEYSNRGWRNWAGAVYPDVLALTDEVEQRPEIDASRTCMMGASFGGYMANWIATHTDRFQAIVCHAGLWDLKAFGPVTDFADFWDIEVDPETARTQSPSDHWRDIVTPMLVVHGDKDYRVPLGEGLALWWRLNENWAGDPADLPHRFLLFPDENHWVLKPQNAILWYETVRAFLAWHVLGEEWQAPRLL